MVLKRLQASKSLSSWHLVIGIGRIYLHHRWLLLLHHHPALWRHDFNSNGWPAENRLRLSPLNLGLAISLVKSVLEALLDLVSFLCQLQLLDKRFLNHFPLSSQLCLSSIPDLGFNHLDRLCVVNY